MHTQQLLSLKAMEIKVIRSNRKTMTLQINKDLEIILRAPYKAKKSEIEKFISSNEAWIEKSYKKMQDRVSRMPVYSDDEEEINRLKAEAERVICPMVDYYAEKLGLYPERIGFTKAKTRFGSCSGKNRISFSCYLMLYDERAIEYVVVHELCHIKHKNHGKEFYNLIGSVMPDYKEREKLLK